MKKLRILAADDHGPVRRGSEISVCELPSTARPSEAEEPGLVQ
jgi:hypothetical protein